jgi:hypothetical protein
MWHRSHSHEGIAASRSGAGSTRIPHAAPGPGAGSPKRRSNARQPDLASRPVTFCSTAAATSASSTRWDRLILQCGSRDQERATYGLLGTKPDTSSLAPRKSGPFAHHQVAPGPHASKRTVPNLPSEGRCSIRPVTGPSGVRHARQIVPSGARWNVGSPAPRRCTWAIAYGEHGQCGRQSRTTSGTPVAPSLWLTSSRYPAHP